MSTPNTSVPVSTFDTLVGLFVCVVLSGVRVSTSRACRQVLAERSTLKDLTAKLVVATKNKTGYTMLKRVDDVI